MFRQHFRFLLVSSVLGALSLAFYARAQRIETARAQPLGRFTAQQMLDRAEPICRRLAPQSGTLSFTAEQNLARWPDGRLHRYWVVDCTDRFDKAVAHLEWDADTGDLRTAGHIPPWPYDTTRPLNRQEAALAAWDWLRTLGVADQASHWRLVEVPKRIESVQLDRQRQQPQQANGWLISLRANEGTASVTLDPYSGHFTLVRFRRQPSAPSLW